jgi:hypothetical protein
VTVVDDRPAPQYGEYATPEEQARAAGLKYIPPVAAERVMQQPEPPVGQDIPGPQAPTLQRQRPYDRFLTVVLLAIAGFSLAQSIPNDLDFSASLDTVLKRAGVGSFTDAALADRVGIWLLVAQSILVVLTFVWAISAMRRGRASFYIPIIGALAFAIVVVIVCIVMFDSSPAFVKQMTEYMQKSG